MSPEGVGCGQEIGSAPLDDGSYMPWDGVRGPKLITLDGKPVVAYPNPYRTDYIDLIGTMTAALTARVDTPEYQARILAMVAVYWALREMQARGVPVQATVFVSAGRRGALDDDFARAGASVVYGRRGLGGVVDLWRLCRRIEPDVLHINAHFLAGIYSLGGLFTGVGQRIAQLNTIASVGRGRVELLERRAQLFTLRSFCTLAVGVCDAARNGTGVTPSRWLTIYNGIRPPSPGSPAPRGYASGVLNVLVLGRLDPLKNIPRALRIIAALRDSGVPVNLHLVGAGPDNYVTTIRGEITRLALGGTVHLHGAVSEPEGHLFEADVLLMPSIREGLPTAILEALSCGLPAVAPRLDGIAEIAARTEGLTLVSLADDDRKWAETLVRAVEEDRRAIRSSFSRSPFQFEQSLPGYSGSLDGRAAAGVQPGRVIFVDRPGGAGRPKPQRSVHAAIPCGSATATSCQD